MKTKREILESAEGFIGEGVLLGYTRFIAWSCPQCQGLHTVYAAGANWAHHDGASCLSCGYPKSSSTGIETDSGVRWINAAAIIAACKKQLELE